MRQLPDVSESVRELNKHIFDPVTLQKQTETVLHGTMSPRRRLPGEQREAELQTLCEMELNRREIEYLHLSPMAREKKGWPDLVFSIHGKAIAVEIKAESGRLSADQETRLHRMGTAPNEWSVHIVRSFVEFHRLVVEALRHKPDCTLKISAMRAQLKEAVSDGMRP